ncbi:MAG: TonB-dependent receptor [Bacteroidales bacterium]|nr:TonB-dependent receptor [Bacteroidales bacterium]
MKTRNIQPTLKYLFEFFATWCLCGNNHYSQEGSKTPKNRKFHPSFLIAIFIMLSTQSYPQTLIKGIVSDTKNNPLVGANVYIEGTYEGTTTNEDGQFTLKTSLFGEKVIAVSYIGYEEKKQTITLNEKTEQCNFILKEKVNELNAAVITAGAFEASDRKRAAVLSSLDVVTTAGSEGDIYSALNTLPGAQKQQESGKLIVRGGEPHETKTYMDGLWVASPYTSSYDDIPARGRFSPFLFDGILFSTGGYSAEYGQALSSVIALNTNGLADENLTSVSLMNVGGGLSRTQRWDNTSITLDANYVNLVPYFMMHKHTLDWEKEPEAWETAVRLNHETPKGGLSKTYVSYNSSKSALNVPNYESSIKDRISLNDDVLFIKTSFEQSINDKWYVRTGCTFYYDNEQRTLNSTILNTRKTGMHSRFGLVNYVNDILTLKMGSEIFIHQLGYTISQDSTADIKYNFKDELIAAYFEGDIKLSNHFALRLGSRVEYSNRIKKMNAAPRVAFAYKPDNTSQFSLAYGLFFQQVKDDYLLYSSKLNFENASHYILNYQYSKNNRLARIELFYKDYHNLITYDEPYPYSLTNFGNKGHGYARGIDFLWRDKKTLKYVDYWISYSFVDAKREYKAYPDLAPLSFVSAHTVSTVCKTWINPISTQASLTYTWTSGRPYDDPNITAFMSEHTKDFHSMNGSISYLTTLFKQFTIVHFSVNNILGSKNIYGYEYNPQPGEDGVYQSHPVVPYMVRSYILAIFISIE